MKLFYKISFTFFYIAIQLHINAQSLNSINPVKRIPVLPGVLSGQVTDKDTKAAVAGATVYIPDLKIAAVADSAGQYHFNALPSGTYIIEVTSVGFKRITKSITINGNTVADFELTNSIIQESPVVVTGLSKATQIRRSPIPIVAINQAYLKTNIATNIIDAIAKVPGVNGITTGPNVSKPIIRGLGYNRVLTLYDGFRQEGQQWGDEHGIEVDQYGVERVEIIKGPSSLTYGSDALAGVVNLIPFQPAPEGRLIGNILTEYQTNNGLYAASGMLGGTKNGFDWMGRASYKAATNYQNKIDGRVYNTAYKETDATLSLGLHRSWGYSHLNLSLFDDLQEIPDGSRDSLTRRFTKQVLENDILDQRPIVSDAELKSYTITPLHQRVQHYKVYTNNNFTIGKGQLTVNFGFQRSVRREFSHPEDPYQNVPGLYLQLNTLPYDVKYHFPEFDGWNLTMGVNGMYQHNTVTNGTEFVIPSYQQFDIGPFAFIKKEFGKLDISGGIRYDSRSFKNDQLYTKPDPVSGFDRPVYGADTVGADMPFYNYKHTFSGVTGSIGATYNFTEQFAVKANLSRGFRAPNIAEISANGVHPGTNVFQIGNGNFKPEFSLQEDIGFSYSSQYVVIDLSLFNSNISNYIFNQKLVGVDGSDSTDGSGNTYFKFQQGKANLYGGELSIDIHPVKSLHFENSVSIVYGLNKGIDAKLKTDSNKYLPFIPPVHGISELRYDFQAKASHIVNGFVKVQLDWHAKQDKVYLTDNTETPTTGYALFNAGIGAGITNKQGKTIFNISIMGNNLFDVAYQDHLSRLKYFEFYSKSPNGHLGIYNMGRNIAFRLDFPLDFKY